ncbi:hypothetical protein [Raineya sp.]|jgi:hypothetical protein
MKLIFASLFFLLGFAVEAQKISWLFESKENDTGMLQTAISLEVNGRKHFIKNGSGGFQEIPKSNYKDKNYKIPSNALTACYGFWGGLQTTLYVVQNGNFLEVKEGFLDSEAPRVALTYKTIKRISFGKQ